MTLKDFIKSLKTPEARVSFASACGTTVGQISQVSGGFRRAGEALAINIERESSGKVRCEDLRPDVDWQYLRASKIKPTAKPKHKAA